MTAVTTPARAGEQIHVPLWAFALLAISMFGSYLVLQENGWIVSQWMMVHEFFHDGRHALGFPCH
jgi:cobalt transporter subunit CbtB